MAELFVNLFTKIAYHIASLIYLLYASIAQFLDVFQLLIRKLAGLDKYYVADENGVLTAQSGDIINYFIQDIVLGVFDKDSTSSYPILSTIFWSMIVFSLIILTILTFWRVIRDRIGENAGKNPLTHIYNMIKAIIKGAAVPICVIVGLYAGQAILTGIDGVSSQNMGISDIFSSDDEDYSPGNVFQLVYVDSNVDASADATGKGEATYFNYDVFGNSIPTQTTTMSGLLFKLSAYSANRVRNGELVGVRTSSTVGTSNWTYTNNKGTKVFNVNLTDEEIAYQIDYAFANNLTLKNGTSMTLKYTDDYESDFFATNDVTISNFSKFNLNAISYFYDLSFSTFNYVVAFVGIAFLTVPLTHICFGLGRRIIYAVILFVIYPLPLGISPYQDKFGDWITEFRKNALGGYAQIFTYNLFLQIIPVFSEIKFFNYSSTLLTTMLNSLISLLFVIAGINITKEFAGIISGWVGGEDVESKGKSVQEDIKGTIDTTVGTAGKIAGVVTGGVKTAVSTGRSLLSMPSRVKEAATGFKDNRERHKALKELEKDAGKEMEDAETLASSITVDESDQNVTDYKNAVSKFEAAKASGMDENSDDYKKLEKDVEDKAKVGQAAKYKQKQDALESYQKAKLKTENYKKLRRATIRSYVPKALSVAGQTLSPVGTLAVGSAKTASKLTELTPASSPLKYVQSSAKRFLENAGWKDDDDKKKKAKEKEEDEHRKKIEEDTATSRSNQANQNDQIIALLKNLNENLKNNNNSKNPSDKNNSNPKPKKKKIIVPENKYTRIK